MRGATPSRPESSSSRRKIATPSRYNDGAASLPVVCHGAPNHMRGGSARVALIVGDGTTTGGQDYRPERDTDRAADLDP